VRNARLLAALLAPKSITAHDRGHHLGWVRCTDLNRALRRNINSARGYQPPIELTAQRLRATR
jgi:hypothetical protein